MSAMVTTGVVREGMMSRRGIIDDRLPGLGLGA